MPCRSMHVVHTPGTTVTYRLLAWLDSSCEDEAKMRRSKKLSDARLDAN
jgi:hypothetical protein